MIATKQRAEQLGGRPKQRDSDAADVIVHATLRPQVHGRLTSGASLKYPEILESVTRSELL